MKKVLTIGSIMQDIFMHCAHDAHGIQYAQHDNHQCIILNQGAKIDIETLTFQLGGGAANSAACFSKLGFNASVVSKIGNDQAGIWTRNQLKQKKVQTDLLVEDTREHTGTAYILPCASGNHTILAHRGANLMLSQKDIPFDQIADFDIVYITSLSRDTSKLLPIITKHAKQLHKFVATNPGTSQLTVNVNTLKQSLPFIDALVCNRFEAELLFAQLEPNKPFHEHSYLQEIIKRGPKIAAITCGKDGVHATDGNKIHFQSIIKTPITSTVGAGDSFSSTFVSFLARDYSIEKALRAGVIQSAHVLQKTGATEGLLSFDEIKKQLD